MVATPYAPAPSRRKRGGLPTGCSAVVLVCLVSAAPVAQAATSPSPDPTPQVQPDAAPGSSTHTKSSPVTQAPAYVPQQSAPQQTYTTPPASSQPAVTAPSHAAAARATQPRAGAPPHQSKPHRRRHHVARHHVVHHKAVVHSDPVSVPSPETAVIATRPLASVLPLHPQRATADQSISNAQLVTAAALLLLLVAAGASVLRLSLRMDDGSWGRPA